MNPQSPDPKKYGFKPRTFETLNPIGLNEGEPLVTRDNEILDILRHNQAVAQEAGINQLVLAPQRPTRRSRDYWSLLFLTYAVIASVVALTGFSPHGIAIGLVAAILATCALTWVLWSVMEKY